MKRTIDILMASVLTIITIFPVTIAACIFYMLYKESPLYLSTRAGKEGKPFTIFKLKSMRSVTNDCGEPLPDEKRLTTYGKFLRMSSLDELPQLINILKGEMSFVGPRPLFLEYNELYTAEQRIRLHVRPGITGLAQVKGRNSISWEEKFRWDSDYVNNQSLVLDLKIIFLTGFKVIAQDGITQQNHATTQKFTGSKSKGVNI
ncbi:sugar transferase [Listeria booriae]|uniref:Sugar transferase n=1 Tax=Listeria booriae TaxID=1552123 RepID=A0A841Y5B0_9LIST|nr:sugar transferase [Listeria booriae]MBC1371537.1 sugar transferase [Listeria booriae]